MENFDFEILKEIVGKEKAIKIVVRLSGRAIYFSKAFSRQITYDKIFEDYNKGVSYSALSAKYGYSESHVRSLINKERKKKFNALKNSLSSN